MEDPTPFKRLDAEAAKDEAARERLIHIKEHDRQVRKVMDTSRLPVREEHLYPEMENPEKLLNLHKLVNNELPNRDFEHLWNEAFSFYSSFCIVDAIVVPENYIIPTCRSSELILEFKQYKNIPGTTKTYRIDAANTNTNTQKHIHVYFDGEQLYAINVDGTPHDGSKYKLSKKDQAFLRDMRFVVPENGILEMYFFKDKPNT